ncbi:hypothetical protein G6F54_014213 [Rhizopus delemar]|nr:hypothetical protein G6F54_014213 [Rhizopus delemar]
MPASAARMWTCARPWKTACRACASCSASRASSWPTPMSATRPPVVTAMRRDHPVAAGWPVTENRRRATPAAPPPS